MYECKHEFEEVMKWFEAEYKISIMMQKSYKRNFLIFLNENTKENPNRIANIENLWTKQFSIKTATPIIDVYTYSKIIYNKYLKADKSRSERKCPVYLMNHLHDNAYRNFFGLASRS